MNFSPEGSRESSIETISVVSDFEGENGKYPTIEIDPNAPGLFLMDIDDTLVNSRKIHGPAAIALFSETFGNAGDFDFGNEEFEENFLDKYISLWGYGDKQEFEMLCEHYGIVFDSEDEKEETLNNMVKNYSMKMEESLKINAQDEDKRKEMILPGVIKFLEEMKDRGIPAAIVTGNSNRSGRAFMKYLGLGKYFVTGGFDDDPGVTNEPYRRANILKSALAKYKEKGLDLPEKAGVFGDTTKDFNATLHGTEGMKPYVFLVATGTETQEKLASVQGDSSEHKPHLALYSLKNLKVKEFFDDLEQYRPQTS